MQVFTYPYNLRHTIYTAMSNHDPFKLLLSKFRFCRQLFIVKISFLKLETSNAMYHVSKIPFSPSNGHTTKKCEQDRNEQEKV